MTLKIKDSLVNHILKMFMELIDVLKNIYETGEDGTKTFIEYNIMILIDNLPGQKFLERIQKYDEDILNKFAENIYIIIKTEKIKEDNSKKNEENIEKPTLLIVDEIFKIAMKDKERLEKEAKEEKENNDKDPNK